MGKRSREKKMAKIEQAVDERKQIDERRQERLAPTYSLTKRLLLTLTIMIILLYVGVVIDRHLPDIISRLLTKGL